MKKSWIIAQKEWSEVFKNRFVLSTVAFLPLMLTALPLVIMYIMRSSGELSGLTTGDMPANFAQACGEMSGEECAQYYIVSQFMLLFMLMPLAIPVTIASYSIVGEKTTRTLEPLLATPIRTVELLAGKALAAAVPAVLATWLGFAIFAIGANLLALGPGVVTNIVNPLWLLAVFLVGPLLAIAAVCVAVMVSSRANDPRVSEQLSMLIVLPLLALFFGQIAGLIIVNQTMVLWLSLALLMIDSGLFAFAIQLFQREAILTRWK